MCRDYEEAWSITDTALLTDSPGRAPPGPQHSGFALLQWSTALLVQGVWSMWYTCSPVTVWIFNYSHSFAMAV